MGLITGGTLILVLLLQLSFFLFFVLVVVADLLLKAPLAMANMAKLFWLDLLLPSAELANELFGARQKH